jgi:hypothetical protein
VSPTLLLLIALALANAIVSAMVLRAPMLSRGQRALQLCFVWLVPVIGAVICAAFVHSQVGADTGASKMDPLYLPGDGGAPDGPDLPGICGCGGDSGGDGGGD